MRKLLLAAATLILGTLLLTFVISFFLPSSYQVSQTIEVARPVEQVFGQVADYNQWAHWSPWQALEPEAKYEISGPKASVGAKMQWTGNKVGSGAMRLMNLEMNQSLESQVDFFEPREGSSTDRWVFKQSTPQSTKVTWTNSGPLDSPAAKWMHVLLFKGFLSDTLQDGLRRLKTHCEAK